MASSFTPNLRLTKQGTGENDTTWGAILNTVLSLVDDAITGTVIVTASADSVELTTANGAVDESRKSMIRVIGTPTSNITVFVPQLTKLYAIDASLGGSNTVTFDTSIGGGGVEYKGSKAGWILCDGTDVKDLDSDQFTSASVENLTFLNLRGTNSSITNVHAVSVSINRAHTASASIGRAEILNMRGWGAWQGIGAPTATTVSSDVTITSQLFPPLICLKRLVLCL